MNQRREIEVILSNLRPLLQADGGDIELVDVVANKAYVRLIGKCAGCPSSYLTLHFGLELALRDAIPGFEELIVV